MSARLIYMGTPEFAVAPLKALLDEGFNISAVITAPDKPAGRGKKLQASAVKTYAQSRGIDVLQPEKLKDPLFLDVLRKLNPDVQVVVAFRMLPEQVWKLPRLGTFNLHASLLPDYRGAAPINHAIINGEKESGVSTFMIDEKIDTGKLLFQEKVAIPTTYSAGELHDALMDKGASLVVKTVKAILSGNIKETFQDELIINLETLHQAPKIFKEDCKINWNWEGWRIHNFIRGLSPVPTAYSSLIGSENSVVTAKIYTAAFIPGQHALPSGSIVVPDKKTLHVAVKDGYISLFSLQLAGKNRMDASSFLNGFKDLKNFKFA